MNSMMILKPVLAMLVLTFVVWVVMFARRIPAMYKIGKPAQTYTTPDKIGILPEAVNYPAYNFRNLLELPVVFYVLCFYLHISGTADGTYVVSAWVFVALRVLHSLVHCTSNTVMTRFRLYAAGALVLWFMLGRAVLGVAWF